MDPSGCYFISTGEECRPCRTPSTAVVAVTGVLIVVSLVGFLLFKQSAIAIFLAEVLIVVLLLVLGLGEWWFFDVIVLSTALFLISKSAASFLGRKKPDDAEPVDDSESEGHDDSHSGSYFVGVIKVALFFLQTTTAILPKGTWPGWVLQLIARLDAISFRIAGIECFNPGIFSIPAVRFSILMASPIAVRCFIFCLIRTLTLSRRLDHFDDGVCHCMRCFAVPFADYSTAAATGCARLDPQLLQERQELDAPSLT